ncbi:uncharacterized protein LOC120084007 [Benincasa hispida]|uniref:uncharacterized protein LOC120084007 n=1 Tax=Benincasa hispida TaxID=102211 RepID=UPI0019029B60|nr:uncharacterized protein LOC120084007 [Benincasa hispida]
MKEVVRLHEVPVSIVSDKDPRFMSNFWKSLQVALGTQLDFSTAFHPQSDGQTERLNQILEDMLRAYAIEFSGSWDAHLHLMKFAYHNSYQSTIGMSPFEALYGKSCRSLVCWDEVWQEREIESEIHWTFRGIGTNWPRSLPIGIAFPTLSLVNNVFHVSMLRKYVTNPSNVVDFEPLQLNDNLSYEERPVEILAREVKKLCRREIAFVKVLWQNHQFKEATWE